MIEKLSRTKSVAVLITAIAKRILLNMQMNAKTQKQNQAKMKYEVYSKACAVSEAFVYAFGSVV